MIQLLEVDSIPLVRDFDLMHSRNWRWFGNLVFAPFLFVEIGCGENSALEMCSYLGITEDASFIFLLDLFRLNDSVMQKFGVRSFPFAFVNCHLETL